MYENEIWCGDCAILMDRIPDNCIDLTVTSPPYDDLREYNFYVFDFEPIARQLWRVTKEGGVVVWVVSDQTKNGSETGNSFRQALYFKKIGFCIFDTMIYLRFGRYPDANRYRNDFEYMFIFSKDVPKTYNKIKDRKNIKPVGSSLNGTERDNKGNLKLNRTHRKSASFGDRGNVWQYQNGKGNTTSDNFERFHPAVYPEALARDHIISWSNPGDLVLDPMCGSGTTLKMAKELGRLYLGIDISQEYCDLSHKRVDGARVPLPGMETSTEKAQQLRLEDQDV